MNKLKELLLQQQTFLSGSFFVFFGSIVGNIAAYLFQLVVGRLLMPADYSVFIALLSILYFTGIPGTSLQTTLAKTISELKAKNELAVIASLFWQLSKYFALFGFFLFALFLVFQNPVARFLNISQKDLIFWMAILAGVSFIVVTPQAFLQGLQRFRALGILAGLGPFLRFGLGILFIVFGFAVKGVLWGLILAAIATVCLGLFLLRKNLRGQRIDVVHILPSMLRFYLPTLLILIALNSFYNSDILLVKHFFNEEMAGFYSATSVLGRVILFATSSLAAVMFPIVSENHTLGKDFRRVFYLTFSIVVIGSFAITLAYFLFPGIFVQMLFGGKYLSVTPFLGRFGLFMCFLSLSFVLVQFFLGIRKLVIVPIIVAAAILQIILIYFYHDSLLSVINANLVSTVFLFVALMIYFFKTSFAKIDI